MFEKEFKDLPPNQEDGFCYYEVSKHFDVTFNRVEANSSVPEHSHEVDVINYVLSGEFILTIDGNTQTYPAGSTITIPANHKHSYTTRGQVNLWELWRKA